MRLLLSALLALTVAAPAQAQMVVPLATIDGKVGCIQGMTGIGRPPSWEAIKDGDAPGGWALTETAKDATDLHFPFCIWTHDAVRDLDATLRFKPISGTREQAGGLMFRAQNATDYFVARASALDKTVKLYRMLGGRRSQIASKEATVSLGKWHSLRVVAADKRIEVFFDGVSMFTYDDPGFPRAGAIGVWNPSDSVTHFSTLLVAPP
ncbi:MAG: family 16 glycoside hydrolase [Acidimicrobiia bacterium]